MKKSINTWSVDPNAGFEEVFATVKEAGFEGIELNIDGNPSPHSLSMEIGETELANIALLSAHHQLPVISISTSLYGGKMGSMKDEERTFAQEVLRKQLFCAKHLDADAILVVPGGIDETQSIKDAFDNSFEILHQMKAEIEASGIHVGVENVWNGFFASPYDMCRFVDELDSPYIRAYFDVGNVVAFSYPEYWIELLAHRIHNIHIKGYKLHSHIHGGGDWVDLLAGSIRWDKVTEAFAKIGFDGYLTAEISKTNPAQSWREYYHEVAADIGKIINGTVKE